MKRTLLYGLTIAAFAAAGCNEEPVRVVDSDVADTGSDTSDSGSDVADVDSDVIPDVPDVGPDAVPDVDPDADADVAPDADADVAPDADADVDPDARPDVDPDAPDALADVGPDALPDVERDAEPDARVPGCGDGIVDPGEQCDDGNDINTDACSNDCSDAFCGDGTMNAIAGSMVFPSPEVTAFELTAAVCDDGASCPAGAAPTSCDVSERPTAAEHGICDALGFDTAVNVEWGGGEGSETPQVHHAFNWECFDYTCVESPFSDFSADCSDFEMLSSIECYGIIAEECDDGAANADAADTCRTDCTLPRCTDGIIDTGEECDDGNDEADDGCSNECLLPQCGDSIINGDEQCDDGNDINDDECLNDCTLSSCGDAIINPWVSSEMLDSVLIDHEAAGAAVPICSDGGSCRGAAGLCTDTLADGSAPEHGMCQSFGYERAVSVTNEADFASFFEFLYLATDWSCSEYECTFTPLPGGFIFCGGSTYVSALECETRGIEDCDEGDGNSDDVGGSCRTDCTLPRCGDAVLEDFRGEECDDGNFDNDDGCSNTCLLPRCGDTSVQGDEECDDGDDIDTDECRNDCTLQICGDGFLADAEDCDDGVLNSEDPDASCRTDCRFPRCGDGVHDTGEECDDGNVSERDECLTTCALATCGDGVRHPFLGEDCDDGNEIDDDECANDCTGDITGFASCSDGDLGSMTGSPVSTGTTVGAGNDYEADCAASARAEDLAFNWVAPTTGSYDLNTEGSTYDTALHVRGFPEVIVVDECFDSVQIACNDDSIFGLRSQIILEVEAGTEYLIIVDGFSTSTGNYILNINPI